MRADRRGIDRWLGVVAVAATLACGCNSDSPSPGNGSDDAGAGGARDVAAEDAGGASNPSENEPQAPQHLALSDFFNPQTFQPGGVGGEGGAADGPPGPPYGTSTECGDAIVGPDEECDDGQGGAANEPDACTDECQTRDEAGGPAPTMAQPSSDRYLGAGRHPVSGLEDGFITTYVNVGGDEPSVGATLFNIWGQPAYYVTVSEGGSPIYEANQVAAALPGGRYAVAWGDFDGDGSDLGVALREVKANGSLGPLRAANAGREFSQVNPDMGWTGSQLVVAWEDYSDPLDGPDLRYRLFDENLNAISDDLTLADSELPEAAVALAGFNDGWAAAYREGAVDGSETIVVKVGDDAFRIGPIYGGPLNDRAALVELDATHLLVVFSAGTDPSLTGTYNVPRIRYAVVDTAGSLTPPSYPLDPLDDFFTLDSYQSHLSPAAAQGYDGVYVSWRSEARPGDAAGDQIWLKYLTWDPNRTPALEWREQEMLIPRVCEGNLADQRTPALARVGLPQWGALAVAWDEYGRSQGTGEPDVVVHYAPTHPRDLTVGSVFTENFRGANGSAWSSHWTKTPASTLTVDIFKNEGRIASSAAGNTINYVNDHTARDVELLTKVRFNNNNEQAGLIARRTDAEPTTYLGFRFGNIPAQPFTIFSMVNGARTDIQTLALPFLFQNYTHGLDYWMRFQAKNDAVNGTINVAGKFWLASLPEPAYWTLSGNVNAASTATFIDRVGRFGIYSNHGQSNRTIVFDDFRASFFEGSLLGEPGGPLAPALPLRRSKASYRTCTPSAPCTIAEGCCSDTSECSTGLTCSTQQAEYRGVGSHARVCAPDHCTDQLLNSDELRADCGGNECPPCACDTAGTPGGAGYCTEACPCGVGGTDCGTSSQCLAGLICGQEKGYKFGWGQGTDACLPTHCMDRVQSGNETGVDTGGSCGHVVCFPSANGGYQHCTPSCPCPKAEGNVNYKDECQGALVVGVGARWGYAFDVCVAAHCANNVKDADETGKDCGGVDCGPICPP